MTDIDAALLRFARKYIKQSYHAIIAALAERPMTVPELRELLPDMTAAGVKHAIVMLRKCDAVYVKEWIVGPGQKQMVLALGDRRDAPQIRNSNGRQLEARRNATKQARITPQLPTHHPRLGMLGV